MKRTRNLVTRLTDEELAMAQALAKSRDESMMTVVRRLLKAAYVDRFGVTPPPGAQR